VETRVLGGNEQESGKYFKKGEARFRHSREKDGKSDPGNKAKGPGKLTDEFWGDISVLDICT